MSAVQGGRETLMRYLLAALVLVFALAAPVMAAPKKHRTAAVLATASITIDPATPAEFGQATISWTGADGGFLYIVDACRTTFLTSGVGSGSFTDTMPCAGPATAYLLSVTSGLDLDANQRLDVLAQVSYEVSP